MTQHTFCCATLRATLDEGPRSKGPMDSSNLIGPKAFRQGSKTKKWQIEAKPTWHLFWRENQLVRIKKMVAKGELLILRTKNERLGTKVQSNSRIQFARNQSKKEITK
jgi:hypothetical protein